jgi:hypothetical protein
MGTVTGDVPRCFLFAVGLIVLHSLELVSTLREAGDQARRGG